MCTYTQWATSESGVQIERQRRVMNFVLKTKQAWISFFNQFCSIGNLVFGQIGQLFFWKNTFIKIMKRLYCYGTAFLFFQAIYPFHFLSSDKKKRICRLRLENMPSFHTPSMIRSYPITNFPALSLTYLETLLIIDCFLQLWFLIKS